MDSASNTPVRNLREAVRRFAEKQPTRPSRVTIGGVFCLFALFFGWRGLKRYVASNPFRRLTPVRIAAWAVLLFLIMFFVWLVRDRATPGNESVLGRFNRFAAEWTGLLYLYALLLPLLIWILDKIDPTKRIDERLRRAQKQRVKILDGFAPSPETETLFSDRSIYDAMMGTLKRLEARQGAKDIGERTRFRLCLLLCSPAVDYPGNHTKPWGKEFITMIKGFIDHPNIHFDICHLPVEPLLGYDPMEDFLSVLANYIVDRKMQSVRDAHRMLCTRTKKIADEITGMKEDYPERFTIRPPMLDVPFQIVLVMGDDMKEVVVSFAGREILERGDSDPRGFFSSDPYVVETFHKIYEDYVKQGGRACLVPPLTQDVIQEHSNRGDHRLLNYCHTLDSLEVGNGCFSPAIANSTKFSCWAITKLLTKDDSSILDIGSGTGVLALIAQKTLTKLGVHNPRIVATECDNTAFQTLCKNCKTGVVTKKWKLAVVRNNGGDPRACFLDVDKGNTPVPDGDVGTFSVIIADLPFVDSEEQSAVDQRFFDPQHRSHAALFSAVAMNNWLEKGGKLITAFSSLGGPYDVARFERMISESHLRIVQRLDFHESNYLWIVHVIMRQDDFDPKSFWWNRLNARQYDMQSAGATT